MKSFVSEQDQYVHRVTLCVRVWIEILSIVNAFFATSVTLCVRVWIEIPCTDVGGVGINVTLCVRVWIEITPAL